MARLELIDCSRDSRWRVFLLAQAGVPAMSLTRDLAADHLPATAVQLEVRRLRVAWTNHTCLRVVDFHSSGPCVALTSTEAFGVAVEEEAPGTAEAVDGVDWCSRRRRRVAAQGEAEAKPATSTATNNDQDTSS